MAANSKIAWTDDTFNPWWGCQKVGPGCDHCYAAALDKRTGGDYFDTKTAPRRTKPANWAKPIKWNKEAAASGKRRLVFCASMADVFDNRVPVEWRVDLFELIKATPHLTWILLTKRIGNVSKMLPDDWGDGYPNVWLLITVVNQAEADRDILKLQAVPAAVRGLSVEPMLDEIDLYRGGFSLIAKQKSPCGKKYPGIDWVICGGESGPDRRPFYENWVRRLRDDCLGSGMTKFFYKQRITENGKKIETPYLDGQQWIEFPTSVNYSEE